MGVRFDPTLAHGRDDGRGVPREAARRPPTRAQKLGLVAFGLALALLGLEIVVRLGLVVGTVLHAVTRPEHPAHFIEGVVVHDALLPPARKPEGAHRVLFIGDSFVRGLAVPPEHNLAVVATRALSGVEVLNHGIPGLDAAGEAALLEEYGARLSPDLVVWVFVLNDLGAAVPPWGSDFINDELDGWPPRFSRGLQLIRRELGRVELGRLTEAAYARSLDEAGMQRLREILAPQVAATRARGARFVFAVFPLLLRLHRYPFAAEHRALLRAASEVGAETLDLLPAFAGRDAQQLWVSSADHHPNAEGHALAGRALAPLLRAIPSAAPHRDPLEAAGLLRAAEQALEARGPGFELRLPVLARAAVAVAARDEPERAAAIAEQAGALVRRLRELAATDPALRERAGWLLPPAAHREPGGGADAPCWGNLGAP